MRLDNCVNNVLKARILCHCYGGHKTVVISRGVLDLGFCCKKLLFM